MYEIRRECASAAAAAAADVYVVGSGWLVGLLSLLLLSLIPFII